MAFNALLDHDYLLSSKYYLFIYYNFIDFITLKLNIHMFFIGSDNEEYIDLEIVIDEEDEDLDVIAEEEEDDLDDIEDENNGILYNIKNMFKHLY